MESLHRLDAWTLARGLEQGEIRAEDLVRDCLERIAAREPVVRAWAALDPERALDTARRLDRQPRRGPLHGIPFGVKDIIDTADLPTGYGSPIYARHRPAIDGAAVAVARDAGGIVLGKTVTAEFAHRFPGPTTNPHDSARTPGGSSSGSAAAVADFMVPLALGTQTTASTIRPASYCGVIGYRPTYGLVSCAGVKPSAASFDTIGIFARTIPDCRLLLDILLEAEPRPLSPLERPPSIGVCRTAFWPMMEPEAAARFEAAAAGLAAAGARIADVTLPAPFATVAKDHRVIASFELSRNLATERLTAFDQLSALLREGKMAEGLRVEPADYVAAAERIERARAALPDLFGEADALLTPASSGIAPRGFESTGPSEFCAVWTALHLPAVSVPLPSASGEMPLGVQLVARRGADRHLCEVADWVLRQL